MSEWEFWRSEKQRYHAEYDGHFWFWSEKYHRIHKKRGWIQDDTYHYKTDIWNKAIREGWAVPWTCVSRLEILINTGTTGPEGQQ